MRFVSTEMKALDLYNRGAWPAYNHTRFTNMRVLNVKAADVYNASGLESGTSLGGKN